MRDQTLVVKFPRLAGAALALALSLSLLPARSPAVTITGNTVAARPMTPQVFGALQSVLTNSPSAFSGASMSGLGGVRGFDPARSYQMAALGQFAAALPGNFVERVQAATTPEAQQAVAAEVARAYQVAQANALNEFNARAWTTLNIATDGKEWDYAKRDAALEQSASAFEAYSVYGPALQERIAAFNAAVRAIKTSKTAAGIAEKFMEGARSPQEVLGDAVAARPVADRGTIGLQKATARARSGPIGGVAKLPAAGTRATTNPTSASSEFPSRAAFMEAMAALPPGSKERQELLYRNGNRDLILNSGANVTLYSGAGVKATDIKERLAGVRVVLINRTGKKGPDGRGVLGGLSNRTTLPKEQFDALSEAQKEAILNEKDNEKDDIVRVNGKLELINDVNQIRLRTVRREMREELADLGLPSDKIKVPDAVQGRAFTTGVKALLVAGVIALALAVAAATGLAAVVPAGTATVAALAAFALIGAGAFSASRNRAAVDDGGFRLTALGDIHDDNFVLNVWNDPAKAPGIFAITPFNHVMKVVEKDVDEMIKAQKPRPGGEASRIGLVPVFEALKSYGKPAAKGEPALEDGRDAIGDYRYPHEWLSAWSIASWELGRDPKELIKLAAAVQTDIGGSYKLDFMKVANDKLHRPLSAIDDALGVPHGTVAKMQDAIDQAYSSSSGGGASRAEKIARWIARNFPGTRSSVARWEVERDAKASGEVPTEGHAARGLMVMSPTAVDGIDAGKLQADLRPVVNQGDEFDYKFSPVFGKIDEIARVAERDSEAAIKAGRAADAEAIAKKARTDTAEQLDRLWPLTRAFGVENMKATQLTAVFRTFMDGGRFEDMIDLYKESISGEFRTSPVIRQFLAVALNKVSEKKRKAGDKAAANKLLDEAERILLAQSAADLSGEDYAILGKVWKLRYEAANERYAATKNPADRATALKNLRLSIATLQKGFLQNFEFYPGINMVYNQYTLAWETKDLELARNAELSAKMVYFAAEKAGGLRSNDYWTVATMFESAAIAGMQREADALVVRFAQMGAQDWQIESTLGNLRKLRAQLTDMGAASEKTVRQTNQLDYGIKELEGRLKALKALSKEQYTSSPKPAARLAEAMFSLGFMFGEVKSSDVGGNIQFGGQLHNTKVNRWDFIVARQILKTLGLQKAGTSYSTFNDTVPRFLRQMYGIPALEDLHSEEHKTYDGRVQRLLKFLAGKFNRGVTNLMVDLWLRLGDCRPTAAVQQLLFDIWKTDQMNSLMRVAYDGLQKNDGPAYAGAMAKVHALQDMSMLVMDAVIQAPVVLVKTPQNPTGKYDAKRTETGAFVYNGNVTDFSDLEDHTLNILVTVTREEDGTRSLKGLSLVDSWYNNEFKLGGVTVANGQRYPGVPVSLGAVGEDGTIVAGKIRAYDQATGREILVPLKLISTNYGGDRATKSGGIKPNRGDYGQATMRGLDLAGVKMVRGVADVSSYFDAKVGSALHRFMDRVVRRGERQDREVARIGILLRSKVWAREIAGWLDAAYYKGQGQKAPPLLTPEEDARVDEKKVQDEEVAKKLAALYAVETGAGLLADMRGRPIKDVIQDAAQGKLGYEDNLIMARFANATWKAGQAFRGRDLEFLPRLGTNGQPVMIPATQLTKVELEKDFDHIKAAAGLLYEKLEGVPADKEAILAAMDGLLKSKNYAVDFATHHTFEFPAEISGATQKKNFRDEKIAMNQAGWLALESGIGVLGELKGRTPVELMRDIVAGKLDQKDMFLLARFANAAWKAGQPFRDKDLGRITRPVMKPFDTLLAEDEKIANPNDRQVPKDFVQIQNAARLALARMEAVELSQAAIQVVGGQVTMGGKVVEAGEVWNAFAVKLIADAESQTDRSTVDRLKAIVAKRDAKRRLAFWKGKAFPGEVEAALRKELGAKSRGPRELVLQASLEGDDLKIRLTEGGRGLVGLGSTPLEGDALDALVERKPDQPVPQPLFVRSTGLNPAFAR